MKTTTPIIPAAPRTYLPSWPPLATSLLLAAASWTALRSITTALSDHPNLVAMDWKTAYETQTLWALVALALFGQTLAAENQNRSGPWASAAKILLATGTLLGLIFAASPPQGMTYLTIAQAACMAAAGLCLGAELLATLDGASGGGAKPARAVDVSHLFFLTALNWLVLATVADILMQIRHYADPGPRLGVQTILFLVLIPGFAGNTILAAATRTLPPLLAPIRLRDRAWLLTGLLWNAGLILALLSSRLGPATALAGFASMAVAAAFFLLGLDFLRTRPGQTAAPAAKPLIALAFLSLLAALALLAATKTDLLATLWTRFLFLDTAKHLLTAGFLGTLLLTTRPPFQHSAFRIQNSYAILALILTGLTLRTLAAVALPPANWPTYGPPTIALATVLQLMAFITWAARKPPFPSPL